MDKQFKAYVINLDSRTDRWAMVEKLSHLLNLEVVRVSAFDQTGLDAEEAKHAPVGVVATWKSHCLAAKNFLTSGDEYGLILEDDFFLDKSLVIDNVIKFQEWGVDFLQIGFLKVTPWESINIYAYNVRNFVLRVINFLSKRIKILDRFQNRKLISELGNTPWSWVVADIRPGGQAYVISRKFAVAMQEFNNPTCLSTDGFFEALGKSRSFNMYRLAKSLIGQTDSPTSVTKRFNND